MRFSADNRERHRYYESALSELHIGLQTDGVQESLGYLAVSRLSELDTFYYLPYDAEGISIPRRRRDTSDTPVVVVRPGEQVGLDKTFASNSPAQKTYMREQLLSWNPIGGAEQVQVDVASNTELWDTIEDRSSIYTVPATNSPNGSVFFRSLPVRLPNYRNVGKNPARVLIGKPIVALFINPENENLYHSRELWHEWTHVDDVTRRPFHPYDSAKASDMRLRFELRAFHSVWAYAMGLHNSTVAPFAGDENLLIYHSIEHLRQEQLDGRRDPFEPTGALKKALIAAGVDDVYLS